MIALALVAIIGMLALVVDLGNGWRNRRALIPGTDAAALAAAQDFVNGESTTQACDVTAESYLQQNVSGANMIDCDPGGTSDRGWVEVTAEAESETWFASVFGGGNFDVESTSIAAWGPPIAVTGLRPIGLCFDGNVALQNLINNPPTTEQTITVPYGKDDPNACGGASTPGNWGTIDFDGGSNSNNDTKDWIENGYPDGVFTGNHTVTTCSGEPHCYEGDTGALSGIGTEVQDLQDSGQYFTLPIFNYVENPGSNALFHLMGVIRVRLIDHKINGAQSTRYFTFGVLPGLITGTCCDGGGDPAGSKVIALCGVLPGEDSACRP